MAGQFWGRKPTCRNGASCSFLATDSCWYEHSEYEKDVAELIDKPLDQMSVWELCKVGKVGDIKDLKEALERKREDVNSSDSEGNTGLMWAIENDDEVMVKLLVETPGIELTKKNNKQETALHKAAFQGRHMLEILLPILPKKDVDLEDINKRTPLDIAMEMIDEDSWSTGSAVMIIKAMGKEPKEFLTPDVFVEREDGSFIYLYEWEEEILDLVEGW
eukprot:GFUD01109644.1.p1 GENE.GFUD01109644.1~~GFUD01109644.1.p1  ORF type:complete len:218 (+),score=73.49 GFUD01109644.1:58-711(+)